MQNFELDLQFMSKLSQIAKNKKNFLDDATKIIDGEDYDKSKSEQLLSLGTSIDTDNDEVLDLDNSEKTKSEKCFRTVEIGNLDSNTVFNITKILQNLGDINLNNFLLSLQVEAFQSDHFLSIMAKNFTTVIKSNKNTSLYDFLNLALPTKKTSDSIDIDSVKNLLEKFTIRELLMADLVHGRMISPFEKESRKCATKTGYYSGEALYTKSNYSAVTKSDSLKKYSYFDLLGIKPNQVEELKTHFEKKKEEILQNFKKNVYKDESQKMFFQWVGELGFTESNSYTKVFKKLIDNRIFGEEEQNHQKGGVNSLDSSVDPEIAVAIAVSLVSNEKEKDPKVLFRQYAVIVYDRLIELTLGKNFNDLMETQKGYGDFRINNFKKVFASINDSDNVLLLQEFDKSYKSIMNRNDGIFEEKKLKKGSASAIYCNGTIVDIKIDESDVVAASLEKNGKKILFVSFHADSKGTDTLKVLKEALIKFSEGEYQYLIIGADTNAKTPDQRQALYRLVSSNNGKIYSIAHSEDLLPTSIGMRSLLQSQFSKALDSIEETIDYLMIFGKDDSSLSGLKVNLNTEFYQTSREGLSIGNPSDHIPLFFKVTLQNEEPPLKILTYNMAGPNTNVVEYMKYKDDKSYNENGIAHISEYEKLFALEILPEQTDIEEIKKIAVSVVVANESQSQ
jgi:hypothetical protein